MNLEELSRAIEGPLLKIPGFRPDPAEPGGLRPYQRAGIDYGLRARGVLIADQMGLGKTLQALSIVATIGAFPVLITAPAFGRLTWAGAIRKFFPAWDLQLIDRMDAPIERKMATIISYSLLGAKRRRQKCNCPHDRVFHDKKSGVCKVFDPIAGQCKCASGTPRESVYLGHLLDLNPRAVIFDESHFIKTAKTDRTKAAKMIAAGAAVRLCLSGTPATRPRQLIPQLETLGQMDRLGGSWRFLQEYCNPWGWGNKAGCKFCAQAGADGLLHSSGRRADGIFCRVCKGTGKGLGYWDFSGARNLDELNRRLRAVCYVRRLKADVEKDLPAKTIAQVPLEIENRPAYDAAAADVIHWLEKNRSPAAAFRASQAEEIVRLEVLKQLAVQGKLPQALDWIGDFLESGEKLVVFTVHRATAAAIGERFGAPVIEGGTPMETRAELVARFQTDPGAKLIVLNIAAGGTVIELYAASNVAFLELSWEPWEHEQAEDRLHRRGLKSPLTAWYLIAQGTIEQEIFDRVLPAKAATASGFTDGAIADGIKASVLARFLGSPGG